MFSEYIYFCFYIVLRYLITHDHTDLTQHFDALHACCSDNLPFKCLYADHKTYILLADSVIQSFCETEYVISTKTNKKTVWLRLLLIQLHAYFVKASVKLLTDNQKIITFIKNSEHYWRTKYIDVKYHWIKKTVKNEIIEFKYISIEDMIADGLTKSLRAIKFNKFLRMLEMLEEANWSNWMLKRVGNTRVILVFKQVKCMQETLKRAT